MSVASLARTFICRRCGEDAVLLPASSRMQVKLRCGACKDEQKAEVYISFNEQMQHLTKVAEANRANYEAAKVEGVVCTGCGASVPLPASLDVPAFACSFCQKQLLVAQYVAPELLLGEGLKAMMAEARADAKSRDRWVGLIVAVVIAVVLVLVVGAHFLITG